MKKALALFLVAVLCLSLVACAPSKEKLVGTWSGSWTYNGNEFTRTFVLESDGTYTEVMYKNGEYYKTETGTYEIRGRNVDLHPNGDKNQSTPHKYRGGKLYNADHAFVKQ